MVLLTSHMAQLARLDCQRGRRFGHSWVNFGSAEGPRPQEWNENGCGVAASNNFLAAYSMGLSFPMKRRKWDTARLALQIRDDEIGPEMEQVGQGKPWDDIPFFRIMLLA